MALLTSAPISSLAIELLRRSLVLVNTVSKVPAGELAGPSGGTVTVRVPVPRAAREQASPTAAITYDAVDEVPVDVSVGHYYNGTLLGDEDLTLSLQSYGRQVLLPQVESVARRAEDELVAVMNALDADPTIAWAASPDPEADDATVLAIREQLTVNETPAGNRYVAVAPDITTRLLGIDKFVRADARGDDGSALESAIIGRVYGITFVESGGLDAGNAVAYHKSGFAFASARPTDPGGGADSSTASEGGVSVRHVLAFDPGHLATAGVTSVFAGASVVPDDDPADSGSATEIKRAIRVEVEGS